MTEQLKGTEKAQIKSLMKDDRWDAVVRFLALKIEQWRAQEVTGTTAFEELRAMHTRDGKVAGVIELFDQMERQALE